MLQEPEGQCTNSHVMAETIYFQCLDFCLVTNFKQKVLPLWEDLQGAMQDAKSVLINEKRSHFLSKLSQTSNFPCISVEMSEAFSGCKVLRDYNDLA